MAVFLMNECKFEGCGITFRTLGDLIQHIEETHIDFDPRVLEKQESQQPPCIPISYVLRFFTDAAKKDSLEYLKAKQQQQQQHQAIVKRAHSPAVSVCSTTPSGSDEFDDDEVVSESDDSNDSWTTQEEFSSEFIMRYGSRIVGNPNPNEEKPFACPVPGCKKRYKNINGIKYHAKNGHRKDARIKKAYRCHCGKSYKTVKGLRAHSHMIHYHMHNCGGNHVVPAALHSESIPVAGGGVNVNVNVNVDQSVHVGFGNTSLKSPATSSSIYTNSSANNANNISIGTQLRLAETPSPPSLPILSSHGNLSILPTTPPPTPTSPTSSSLSSPSATAAAVSATLSTITTPTYAICANARGISAAAATMTMNVPQFPSLYPNSPISISSPSIYPVVTP